MNKSDNLLELIRSLTKAEKRTFKLSTRFQKGDKLYLKLFDILEKQSASGREYDELEIKKHIKDSSFIKNLSRNKNYLYQLVIKSLSNSDSENLDVLFHEMMKQASILNSKGLFEQAKQLAAGIPEKTKITEREKIACLICLNDWNAESLSDHYLRTGEFENIDKTYSDALNYLKAHEQSVSISRVYMNMVIETGKKELSTLNEYDREKIEQIISALDPISPKNVLVSHTRITLFMLHIVREYIKPNNEVAFERTCLDLLNFLESVHYKWIEYNRASYSILISSAVTFSRVKKNWKVMNECLKHIDLLVANISKYPSDNHETSSILQRMFYTKLQVLKQQNRFKEAIKHIEENKQITKKKHTYIGPIFKIVLRKAIVETFFQVGEYKKAFAEREIGSKSEAKNISSQLFDLILCMELEENYLFDSIYRSTKRMFDNGHTPTKTEALLFNSLGKLQKSIANSKERKQIFSELKNELLYLANLPEEKAIFLQFDYPVWLESKIQNTTMAEILIQKTNPT